jgi:hypothetical protein
MIFKAIGKAVGKKALKGFKNMMTPSINSMKKIASKKSTGISFKPKSDGGQNYDTKAKWLMKTSPVKIGKKRAAWAVKNNLSEYPGTSRGKMIRGAANKYHLDTIKDATNILGGRSKKLVAGESNPTSRLLANSKAYGERGHIYKSGQALTGKDAVLETKSKNALTKAFNQGDLGGGVEDPFRVVRGKGKKKGGMGVWVPGKKGKALASVVPASSGKPKKKIVVKRKKVNKK